MIPRKLVLALASAIGMSACSPYPLPQDTSGENTVSIISKVRCEVQNGLRQIVFKILRDNGSVIVYKGPMGQLSGSEIRDRISLGEWLFGAKDLVYFRSDLRDAFKYYSTASIGYEFTLDMTEVNAQGLDLTFSRALPLPAGIIGVGARADRTRQVTRTFRLVDNFEDLFQELEPNPCYYSNNIDIIYPVRGAKPIYDLLDSFIYANEFLHLQGDKEKSAVNKMAETIEFTTKLTGRLEPTFNPAMAGAGFSLTSIGLVNNASRSDRHKVIMTLTVAPKSDPEKRLPNGEVVATNSRSRSARISYANRALDEQRERNTQDAIIQIGNTISRLAP